MLTHHIGCGWKILADIQDCGVWSEGAHFTCFTSTTLLALLVQKYFGTTRLSTPSWQSHAQAPVGRMLTYADVC